jgi:hypothetical protein|tara:strand:- start:166 stop:303 length:138 start_codon:yes stop_codon:yes gene_type:complete
MSGKGSKPRPFGVKRKTFEDNWDKIFNKKKDESKKESKSDTVRKK